MYQKTAHSGILEHNWEIGDHFLKVIVHASPPLTKTPGFRQYQIFVDGQPFHKMPKLYEVGKWNPGYQPAFLNSQFQQDDKEVIQNIIREKLQRASSKPSLRRNSKPENKKESTLVAVPFIPTPVVNNYDDIDDDENSSIPK